MKTASIRVYDCARAMLRLAHLPPYSRKVRLACFGFTIDEVKAASVMLIENSNKVNE